MKKFIAAAIAASLIATPALAAPTHYSSDRNRVEQSHHASSASKYKNDRVSRTDNRRGNHWQKGDRFDRRHAANYRVIDKPQNYNLRNAPSGYRWVSSGDDAVLVGITSGIVAAVVASILR